MVKTYTDEKVNYCIDCGVSIESRRLRCKNCAAIAKRTHGVSNTVKNKCIDCGKEINYRNTRCHECGSKRRQNNIPDKETLQCLISKYSYEEIGRQYNVTGKAVRKWCDKYEISKQKQIHNVRGCKCLHNGNWYEFDTYRDAAQWLINDLGYELTEKNTQYQIGIACKEGTEYKGIKWFMR